MIWEDRQVLRRTYNDKVGEGGGAWGWGVGGLAERSERCMRLCAEGRMFEQQRLQCDECLNFSFRFAVDYERQQYVSAC
jgi:hypothetical protein